MFAISDSKVYKLRNRHLQVTISYPHIKNNMETSQITLSLIDNKEAAAFEETTHNKIDGNTQYEEVVPTIWKFMDSYFKNPNLDNNQVFQLMLNNNIFFGEFSGLRKDVFDHLSKSKSGSLLTYKKLGELSNSDAYRAIGAYMSSNRFPILLPCHRVLASSGLGGYMGKKSTIKKIDVLTYSEDKFEEVLNTQPKEIQIKLLLLKYEKDNQET